MIFLPRDLGSGSTRSAAGPAQAVARLYRGSFYQSIGAGPSGTGSGRARATKRSRFGSMARARVCADARMRAGVCARAFMGTL
jgi:hypothetical protein